MNMSDAKAFSEMQILSQDEIDQVSGANTVAPILIRATLIVVGSLGVGLAVGAVAGAAYYGWQYYNS